MYQYYPIIQFILNHNIQYPNGFKLELSEKDRHNLLALSVLVFYEDAHRQSVGDDFQPAEMVILNYEGQEYVGKLDAE